MKSKTWIIAIVIAFLAVISASCAKTAGKELTDDELSSCTIKQRKRTVGLI
jgi:hypothetical protein